MKRDFEMEFKELKLNEVPDLWNRIEAGLSDKKIAKRPMWRKWGTLAAACLCVVLILPALSMVLGNLGGRKNNYSGSAANNADSATADATSNDMDGSSENIASNEMNGSVVNVTDMSEVMAGAEAVYESDYRAESETTYASDIEESRNALDSSDIVENLQSADALNGTKKSQEAANTDIADASTSKAEKAMSDSAEDSDGNIANGYASTLDLEDGQVINDVVVEILESSVSGKDTLYKAVVKQSDEDGLLNPGLEISIICNSETEYGFDIAQSKKQVLKEKERYEVSLRYEKNNNGAGQSAYIIESGRFVVKTVKNQ